VILLSASVAFASGLGRLGIFGDVTGSNCNIVQPASGLFSIYLVHVECDGATGFQFSAPKPACLNALYLNDTPAFSVVVGNTQTGIAIGYPSCLSGSFLVCTVGFLVSGTTDPCCVYYVMPDPRLTPPDYNVTDCDYNVFSGEVKAGVVNQSGDPSCTCEAIGTEESNWGKIKALYSGE
jgi:hypothetical protein